MVVAVDNIEAGEVIGVYGGYVARLDRKENFPALRSRLVFDHSVDIIQSKYRRYALCI